MENAGKSAVANHICGANLFKDGYKEQTEVHSVEIEDQTVEIIEAPCFLNLYEDDDVQSTERVATFLATVGQGVNLVLFCTPAGDEI